MFYRELEQKFNHYPIFKLEDVFKFFPKANRKTTLNQIHAWIKKGYLEEIRRGIYKLGNYKIEDCFILSDFIYPPAYISLETALNYRGLIPDIPFETTCLTLNKSKVFKTDFCGSFSYQRIKNNLFFGFESVQGEKAYSYKIAYSEKALFDYLYFRSSALANPEGFIKELRLSIPKEFNWTDLKNWAGLVSEKKKTFHKLINLLLKNYA